MDKIKAGIGEMRQLGLSTKEVFDIICIGLRGQIADKDEDAIRADIDAYLEALPWFTEAQEEVQG